LCKAAKKNVNEGSARKNQDYEERMKQREEKENENIGGKNLRE